MSAQAQSQGKGFSKPGCPDRRDPQEAAVLGEVRQEHQASGFAGRRVTAPPCEKAEAVTKSMRADNSPEFRHILSGLSVVFSPPPGREGAGWSVNDPGGSSCSSDLFR